MTDDAYAAALREAEEINPEDLAAAAEFYDRLAAGSAYDDAPGFLTADGYVWKGGSPTQTDQ